MATENQIRVAIKGVLDESGLIKSFANMVGQIKKQSTTLNQVFDTTFSKGKLSGSVFRDMVSAIKQVESAVKSLPQAMSKTFSSLEQSATRSKNAVDEVSKSMDKVAGKKTKATVEVEVKNAVGVQKRVGEILSTGNFNVENARNIMGAVSSAHGVSLSASQQQTIIKSLTKKFNLDTSPDVGQNAALMQMKEAIENEIKEKKLNDDWIKDQTAAHKAYRRNQDKIDNDKFQAEKDIHKQYVAHQKKQADLRIADDATKRKIEKDIDNQNAAVNSEYNKWLESKVKENKQAAINRQKRDKDTTTEGKYNATGRPTNTAEYEAQRANRIYNETIAQSKADEADAKADARMRKVKGPKTYTSKQVTMLPKGYLDGNFGTGGQVVPNIQAYGKFLVEQMGMSVKQAMNKVRPLIEKAVPSAPAGALGSAGKVLGLGLSEQQKTLEATSAYLNKISGGTSRLDQYGNKMTWINDIMRKQGDAVLRLGRYYISFFAITSTIQQFTEAMRQAVAMQDQMLELKKFLPEGSNIGGLRQSAYGMAAEFGVPIDTVLGSYAEFAKQGKSANEIIDMTRSALLGVNVASTDFATTVTYLTTATNVWKGQFSDTTVLIDKLALVQAKSSASSEVLISAMQRSGSMAKTMGVSLDQLFGYIAAVSEKTQLSGEVIGTSLKTIIERAQRMKTLNLLQGMEEFKGQQFVSPISGDIMGAPQILETVAKKWSILTDVQKKFIGEQMAGSRQLNAFIALMENMGRAAELTSGSINSLGYAQKANASEMEKFSKSFQRASTILYELSTAVILPLVGATTTLMNVFSSLATMMPSFSKGVVGALTGFYGFSAIVAMLRMFKLNIANAVVGMVSFVATTLTAKHGIGNLNIAVGNTTAWAAFARNITLAKSAIIAMYTSGMTATNTMRAFWGIMGAVQPFLALAALATSAYMAISSMAESSSEKQKEYNDKLSKTLDLLNSIKNVSDKAAKEKVAEDIAKELGLEGMKKAGLKTKFSESGKIIPMIESQEDLAMAKKATLAKRIGEENIGDRGWETQTKMAAEGLRATMDPLYEALGRNVTEIPKMADALLTFQETLLPSNRQKFLGEIKAMPLDRFKGFENQDLISNIQSGQATNISNELLADLQIFLIQRSIKYAEQSIMASEGAAIGSQKYLDDLNKKLESYLLLKTSNIFKKENANKILALSPQMLSSLKNQTPEEIEKIFANIQSISPPESSARNKNEQLEAEAILREKNLVYAVQMVENETKLRQLRMTGKSSSQDDYLAKYAITNEKILKAKEDILKAQDDLDQAFLKSDGDKQDAASKNMADAKNELESLRQYRTLLENNSTETAAFARVTNQLSQALSSTFDGGIKLADTLSNRLFDLSNTKFTVKVAIETFLKSNLPSWLSNMIFGEMPTQKEKQSPWEKVKSNLKTYTGLLGEKGLTADEKKALKQDLGSAYRKDIADAVKSGDVPGPGETGYIDFIKQKAQAEGAGNVFDEKSGGAAKRDRESTAHYNALERIKKAEADLQKQQQMSSYWEGKMPDKYLLKYDAETAKYESEMQAKKAALSAEEKNLKPDEVKKFKEEIAVLQEKINLQSKYREQAIQISQFEQFESDNRVGMERLRTELSLKSEIYDMEFNALNNPSRQEEKAYLEWKSQAKIAELEAERLIAIEQGKVKYILTGKSEMEAMALVMDSEELKMLDLKIDKETKLAGLIDRQIELKEKARINQQVQEIQGMLSTGIFDALSMKNKNERKKQLAEIAKELSKLGEDSNTAAYGIAQAESTGNIDAINSSRDKWNEVNRQIEEARKKMDEVNNSTNKWKEVLENIGDSVLKKLADKFAEMLINKTGLGDMFGMIFGGIDGMSGGGKKSNAPALSDPRSALGALAMGGLGLGKKSSITDMFMPGISNGSIQYNINAAGGAGGGAGLLSMLGGGFKFGGGGSALGGGLSGSKIGANAGFGNASKAASSASKYGTSQYLTSAMLGYAIGSSTSNRTVGVLGGAAAGFLTGGPIGAILGALGGLLGRKKNGDEAPPVQPAREMYPLFRNVDALDRNTNALMKLSDGIFNAPSTFEVNKVQAERNGTTINNNITINAAGGNAKSIAAEVNAVISNSYQSSLGKMATSTSNWG